MLALLFALPLPARGVEPAEAAAAPPEAPVEFRPLPPIEFPKPPPRPPPPPPKPAPAEPPPSEPETAQPAEPPEPSAPAPEPTPSKPFVWPKDPSDRRLGACLLFSVGAFGSDAAGGLAADLGLRVLPLSLRASWRWFLEEDATTSFQSVRASWNWGLWSSSSESFSLAAYAGLGGGELSREYEDPYTGERGSESAFAGTLEGGLTMEWGPLSLLGLGLEWIIPMEGDVSNAPSFLIVFSISPIVLLGALR